MTLEWLLRHHARTGSADALEMVVGTANAMARGGIYDQLAGGFARYSVDADWVVPHFEKMLYDNALLLRVYVHLWRTTGDSLAERVVRETATFLLRDLRTAEGGFASALDADTDGVEGATYVWTRAQLQAVLGPGDADWAADAAQRHAAGHVRARCLDTAAADGPGRLAQVVRPPGPAGCCPRATSPAGQGRQGRHSLERTRDRCPGRGGGTLRGAVLGRGGQRLARELLLALHRKNGRLLRVSRKTVAGRHAGVLEDYGDLAEGLLALYAVTGESRWITAAGELLDVVLAHFADGAGGFYDTADDAEALLRRPQDPTDNATPSGQAAAAGALLTYSALTGSLRASGGR